MTSLATYTTRVESVKIFFCGELYLLYLFSRTEALDLSDLVVRTTHFFHSVHSYSFLKVALDELFQLRVLLPQTLASLLGCAVDHHAHDLISSRYLPFQNFLFYLTQLLLLEGSRSLNVFKLLYLRFR